MEGLQGQLANGLPVGRDQVHQADERVQARADEHCSVAVRGRRNPAH